MPRKIDISRGYEIAMQAPVPARTDTYSPVPHSFFLDTIKNQVEHSGRLEVTGTKVYTNSNGHKLVFFTSVKHRGVETDPEFGLEMMIGGKSSYDKSMAAALVAGLNVMICSNGVIGGDMVTFKRKHTGTVQEELQEKATEAIVKMEEGFSNLVLEVDILRDYTITTKQKAELMGVMYFEEELITPHQLSVVKTEMEQSEHFRGNTLWDLYNNVTQALKTSHPLNHIENHIALHEFMCGVAGINREEVAEAVEVIDEVYTEAIDTREGTDQEPQQDARPEPEF